jgi:hypothetical protein
MRNLVATIAIEFMAIEAEVAPIVVEVPAIVTNSAIVAIHFIAIDTAAIVSHVPAVMTDLHAVVTNFAVISITTLGLGGNGAEQ